MEWRIFKADNNHKKWSIRGTLFSGRDVKIPGDRDKTVAQARCDNIDALNRLRASGQFLTPELLDWAKRLPRKYVEKLVALDLLDRSLLDQQSPINELITLFKNDLKNRIDTTYPRQTASRASRLLTAMPVSTFADMQNKMACKKAEAALKKMTVITGRRQGKTISSKTYREYVAAIKCFCSWMVDTDRALTNPLAKLKAPGAYEDPVVNRRPWTVVAFHELLDYLKTDPKLPYGRSKWTAYDRAMLYWTAVMTGFRVSELRSLTRAHLNLDSTPATVLIKGEDAKNGSRARVPIPPELADGLKQYVAHLLPDAPLFPMPGPTAVMYALYADLDGAGVRKKFENGDIVDFHTFRSTAICWWITENKLSLLEVQKMARLKTLDLVQKYVRRFLPDLGPMIKDGPKINFPKPFPKAG